MSDGKLIALEGCEGSGKSTVFTRLRKEFSGSPDFIFIRQPGSTAIGMQLRKIILDPENKAMVPLTELLLFYAERAQGIGELIYPRLREGKIVISDRADPSTIAYQLFGRERESDWWKQAMDFTNLIWSNTGRDFVRCYDSIIYLDIDPKIGLRRRAAQVADGESRIDDEDLKFHERVRGGFLTMHRMNLFGPWHLVDASRSPDDVYAKVLKIVESIIAA